MCAARVLAAVYGLVQPYMICGPFSASCHCSAGVKYGHLLVGRAAFACVAVLVQQHPGQRQGLGAFLLAFVQHTALVQWLLRQVAAGGDFSVVW